MNTLQIDTDATLVLKPAASVQVRHFDEVPLYFAGGRTDIDQKRGLTLYGPADKSNSGIQTIRVGVVSSGAGIHDISTWIQLFNEGPIRSSGNRPFLDQTFVGFVNAFHCKLIISDSFNEEILTTEIDEVLRVLNPNLRIRKTAELYASKVRNICRRVSRPDIIICHEPTPIEQRCGAGMTSAEKKEGSLTQEEKNEADKIRKNIETYALLAPLDEDTKSLIDMRVDQDFRALLKARCLEHSAPIQILTQSILSKMMGSEGEPSSSRKGQDASTIAWNLAAALYYKANHFPWRVGQLQSGTCYIGISFYFDKTTSSKEMHASLAQIFSDTGEGMVVRGNSFRWDVEEQGEPRLGVDSAFKLLSDAIGVYKQHHNDQPPNRVVVHKSSRYSQEEKDGFLKACSDVPKRDLLALSPARDVFFYRNGDNPVLRGSCIPLAANSYLVYTKGYITYQRGFHKPRIPRPLEITQHYGDSSPDELAREVLALTRLNWNTTDYCIFSPVTLEFSDRVGEILGRVPEGSPIKEMYYHYM